MNKQRKRGFSVKPEGRILIEQKMRDKGYNRDKLAEVAEISIDTINSLVRGENKERKTIEAVARALDIQLTEIVDASELYPQVENTAKDDTNINWVQVCHKMLEEQQEQQRIRRKASAMGYEVNVHVPLGLVERKQQQRRNENVERKEIYQLESEVITKTYQHPDFLQEVINKGYQGKNKHIAIVGEPGAGKTTLLNAIASDIKDKNQKLPIFISLGSLQGMTLADYILKKWLPDAIRLINIVPTSEIEAQLQTEFYQGNFYLLLDGVDEMGESSPIQALNKISQELTSWLGQARVILTCRLNVWDATVNNNILPGFNTFKTQEFNPEQINTFVAEWFQVANNINGGEKLIAQLQEEGKERIRDLVTNPLRLCLLCQIFDQNDEGELPETKAQFYELFTRYFYEWKPELVPDLIKSYELKQELHQALGKLALAGINSDLRFRLKRSFAVKAMGDEKLFHLACEVGWLNQVDRDAVNDEDVYAFFHPNFQEYFAALVIDDWRYFLNHNNANPNPFIKHNNQDCVYRIFEGKWKEVILLWFGRQNLLPNIKDEFMLELSNFDDGCRNLFRYHLFYIASDCLREFSNFRFNNVYENEDSYYTLFEDVWLYYELDFSDHSNLWRRQTEKIRESLIRKLGSWMHHSEWYDDLLLAPFMFEFQEYENNKKIIKQLKNIFKEEINWINNSTQIIDMVDILISNDHHIFIKGAIINRLVQICSEDKKNLFHVAIGINCNLNSDTLESLLYIHQHSGYFDLEMVKMCIHILYRRNNKTTLVAAFDYLYDISNNEAPEFNLIREIVLGLNKKYLTFLESKKYMIRYWYCYSILLNCCQNMTYPEFYRAWHGNSPTIKNLENQFTDTHSELTQLQPTEKTYPLTLNLKTLQDETEIIEISQEICNQIYFTACPENPEIPQVNNAPQLKSKIPQIKKHLQTENLALIINNCEPNQEMIKFCNKLTDVLHIAFITEQPLDAPLKGFPNQPNLLNVIQHWINEI